MIILVFVALFLIVPLDAVAQDYQQTCASSGEPVWEYYQRDITHFTLSSVGVEVMLKTGQVFNKHHKITWINRFISSAIMISIGIAKEEYDHRISGGKYSHRDLVLNFTGIVTGNILQWEF